jgi:hypothetical protein
MPEAGRIRADSDGGPLAGGAPRAVWLTLGTVPGAVSVQSAAERLVSEKRPCHLVWDPVTGNVVQLISALRAGRALSAAGHPDRSPERVTAQLENVNAEGRVCVQIGVLSHPREPFTGGAVSGLEAIVSWLDSWGVPRRWPAGRPEGYRGDAAGLSTTGLSPTGRPSRRSRVQWARGGHFGASQVPWCDNTGPGAIDTDRITGPHGRQSHELQVRPRGLLTPREAAALPVPALAPAPAPRGDHPRRAADRPWRAAKG